MIMTITSKKKSFWAAKLLLVVWAIAGNSNPSFNWQPQWSWWGEPHNAEKNDEDLKIDDDDDPPNKGTLTVQFQFLIFLFIGNSTTLHCTAGSAQSSTTREKVNCIKLHSIALPGTCFKIALQETCFKSKTSSKEFHQIFSCPPPEQLQNFCFTKTHDCLTAPSLFSSENLQFTSLFGNGCTVFISDLHFFVCIYSFCLCYVSVCIYSFVCWIKQPRLILASSSPPIIDSWVCIVSYHYVSVFSFVCVWGDLRLTLPSSSPPIMVSWGSSLPPPSSPPPITINRNP